MAQTGVDVVLELNTAQKAFGKIYKALGLDSLGKAAVGGYRLEVTLDGESSRLAPLGSHFLPCAPGEHTLTVALGDFLGKMSLSKRITRISLDVHVDEGQVTVLRLRWPNGLDHLHIDEVTTRPAEA